MNGKHKNKLGARLSAIASQVRKDTILIDVGTDHAYLPVSLAAEGKIRSAIASDIAPGPLSRAERAVKEAGLGDRIRTLLSDGLENIALCPPCDIVIAGMGGELIAGILSRKDEVRRGDVRLILQPMTKAEVLRRYLSENGFAITAELLAEEGKIYPILVCNYTAEPYSLTDAELVVGRTCAYCGEQALLARYVSGKLTSLKTAAEGKRSAGYDCSAEDRLLAELEALIRKETNS